jgi:hypothetical protein
MPEYRGKLTDPEWRHERAVKAANARTSVDAHIAAIIENGELSPEQRQLLAAVLIPSGDAA